MCKHILFALGLFGFVLGCGKADEKKRLGAFGAPKVSEIIDAAAPSGIKGGEQSLTDFSLVCTTCTTVDGFLDFAKSTVFSKSTDPMIAGTNYYRYWVDVVDATLAELNERIEGAEVESAIGACMASTPVQVDFTIAIGGSTVTESPKVQCWESQSTPNGRQDFAFGQNEETDDYWFVYRTEDEGTQADPNFRVVIAKATADGNEAEVWFVGGDNLTVPDSAGLVYTTNFQRIIANKENKSFTFNSVQDTESVGQPLSSFYGRSNGIDLYMEARSYDPNASEYADVIGMAPGTGICVNADDIAIAGSNCEVLTLPPSNFGYSSSYHSSSYSRGGNTVVAKHTNP